MIFLLAGIPFGASVLGSTIKWGSRLVLAVKAFNFVSGYGALAASSLFESEIDVNAESIMFPEHLKARRFNVVNAKFTIDEVIEKGQKVCGETVDVAGKSQRLHEDGEYFYCAAENSLIFAKKGLPLVNIPVMFLSPEGKEKLSKLKEGTLSQDDEKDIRNIFKTQFIQARPVFNEVTNPKIKTKTIREQGVKVEVCTEVTINGQKRPVNPNGEYFLYGNNLVIAQYGYPRLEIDLSDKPEMLAKLKAKGNGGTLLWNDECELRQIIEAKIKEQNEALLDAFVEKLPRQYKAAIKQLRDNERKLKALLSDEEAGVFDFLKEGVAGVIDGLSSSDDDFSKALGYSLRMTRLSAQKKALDKDKANLDKSRNALNENDSWRTDGKLKELKKHLELIGARKKELEKISKEMNNNENFACRVFANNNRGKELPLAGGLEKLSKAIHAKLDKVFPDVSFFTKLRFRLTGKYTSYKIFRETVCGQAVVGQITEAVGAELQLRKETEDEIKALNAEIIATDDKIKDVNAIKSQIVEEKARVKAKVATCLVEIAKQEEFVSNQKISKNDLTQDQEKQQAEIAKITEDVAKCQEKRAALLQFYKINRSGMNAPTLLGKENIIAIGDINLSEVEASIANEKVELTKIDKETNVHLDPTHVVSGGQIRLDELKEMSRSLDPNIGYDITSQYITGELEKTKEALVNAKAQLKDREINVGTFKRQSLDYAKDTITMVMSSIETQLTGYDAVLAAAVEESKANPFFHEHGLLYQATQQRGEFANYLNDPSLMGQLDAKGEGMRQKLLALEGLPAEQYSDKLNEIKNGNLEQLKNGLSEALNQFNKFRSILKGLEEALTDKNYAEKIEEIWVVIVELQDLSKKIDRLKLEVEAATKLAQENAIEADKIIAHVAVLAKAAEDRTAAAQKEAEASKAEIAKVNAEAIVAESKPTLVEHSLNEMKLVADIHVSEARKDIQEKTAFIDEALKGMSESSVELKQLIESLEAARQAGDIAGIRAIHAKAKTLSEQNHDNYAFIQAAILVRQACAVLLLKGQIEQLNNAYAEAENNSTKQAEILAKLDLKKQQINKGLDDLKQELAILKIEAEHSEFSIVEGTSLRREGKQAGLLVEVNGKRLYDEDFLMLLNELNMDIVYAVEAAVKETIARQTPQAQSELRVVERVLDKFLRSSALRPTDVQYAEIEVGLFLNKIELADLLANVKKVHEGLSVMFVNDKAKAKALIDYIEAEVAKAEGSKDANTRLDSKFFDGLIQKIKGTGDENTQPYSGWIAKVSAMKERYEEAKKEYFKKELMATLTSEPQEDEKLEDRLINLGSRFFGNLVASMDDELALLVTRNAQESSESFKLLEIVTINDKPIRLRDEDAAVYYACNVLKQRAVKMGAKLATEENRMRNEHRIAVEAEQAAVAASVKKDAESLIIAGILRVIHSAIPEFSLENAGQVPEEVLKKVFEQVSPVTFERIVERLKELKERNTEPKYSEHYEIWLQAARQVVVDKNIVHRTLVSKSNNSVADAGGKEWYESLDIQEINRAQASQVAPQGNPFAEWYESLNIQAINDERKRAQAFPDNPFDTEPAQVSQVASQGNPFADMPAEEVKKWDAVAEDRKKIWAEKNTSTLFQKPAGENTSPEKGERKGLFATMKVAIVAFIADASTWITTLFESGGAGFL